MTTEENPGMPEPAADTSALDALAVESGVVDNAPEPGQDIQPEPTPAEEPKPGEADKPEAKPEGKPEDKPKEKTALEVVREQMAESRAKAEQEKKDAEASKDAPAPDKAAPTEPDPKKDLLTKAEWAALSDRAKARIGWLGNELKTERKLRSELEPRAQMFDEMAGFVTATGMSQEQFVEGLNIMGWLVTDPVKAYEALKPIYENLQAHMGERLPFDLQEQVDDGRITPELAKELAFNRSQRDLLETKNTQRAQYETELERHRRTQEAEARNAEGVQKTIADWQNRQLATDPDYRLKAALISDRAFVMVKQENPVTPEALLDLLNRAKGEVDKRIAGQQKKRGLNPVNVPSAGGTLNPQPKTALEAARMALAAMR